MPVPGSKLLWWDEGSGILPLQSLTRSRLLCFLISLLWFLQPTPPLLGLDSGRGGLAAPSFFLCLPPPETPSSLLSSPDFLRTLTSISLPKLIPLLSSRCPHLFHEVSQTSSGSARSPVFCPFLLYTRSLRGAAGGWELERCKVGVTPCSQTCLCMGLEHRCGSGGELSPMCCKTLQKDFLIPSLFLCIRLCVTKRLRSS